MSVKICKRPDVLWPDHPCCLRHPIASDLAADHLRINWLARAYENGVLSVYSISAKIEALYSHIHAVASGLLSPCHSERSQESAFVTSGTYEILRRPQNDRLRELCDELR
jgi:hypothetical protein